MEETLRSVGLHKEEELSALKERMEGANMRTMDLTNNDLAKDHLRHLVPPSSFALIFCVQDFCCIVKYVPAIVVIFVKVFWCLISGACFMNLGSFHVLVNDIRVYMQMGGRAHVQHELLYRFVFPERQGALMKFLDAFSPSWNITLFHYRSQVFHMLYSIWSLLY